MTEKNNREGEQIPNVAFPTRQGSEWVDVTTDEIFKGKNVIVFSLPGAFTPTCSSSHVPRYNHLYEAFKKEGVDDIVCVSVNDTFVMNEWSKDQHAEKIRFIADGNGEFTKGMDMLVDKSDLGFGMRSWRYSMLVNDGKIIKQFIEPDVEGDPFEVSDADTMFKYIAPTVQLPSDIVMFSKEGCQFCARAKDLLNKKTMQFEELMLGDDYTDSALRAVSGKTSTPQIFIDGEYIGGSEELEKHLG